MLNKLENSMTILSYHSENNGRTLKKRGEINFILFIFLILKT